MSERAHILVIDAGTTGIRALVYDRDCRVVAQGYTEFPQYYPHPGQVEQDPREIWQAARDMATLALEEAALRPDEVAAVGITNQRATTIVWDRETGRNVGRAIVWQDTRTAARADELRADWGDAVYARTGWQLAPVYSSLSLEWILKHRPEARELADAGRLAFGTVDSWLIHCLTGGATHVISASNASVSGAYDLLRGCWYEEWLTALKLPPSLFPDVCDDAGEIGRTTVEAFGAVVPIGSAIADQHSALFAQGCTEPGSAKCTHGTGTFLDVNVGENPVIDTASGLTCQIAWRFGGKTTYSLEGYAGSTGAAVQWLRDGAGIIATSGESEQLARTVDDNGGVYFVPALTGLSAPYWDAYARGMIIGITPGTTRGHLARATLEGVAFSVRDFLEAMSRVSGCSIHRIGVDGGAARNDLLVQIQADELGTVIWRPRDTETTGLGAAMLAGLGIGLWRSSDEVVAARRPGDVFEPSVSDEAREGRYRRWKRAVERARDWAKP